MLALLAVVVLQMSLRVDTDAPLMTLTVDSLTHVNQVMRSPFSDIARIMIHIKDLPISFGSQT